MSLAVVFGLGVGITASWVTAGQFYAGYLTEYSLSPDNLFIFYVIMGWFAVSPARQHRVLLLGIGLGAGAAVGPHRGRGGGPGPVRLAVLPARRHPGVDRHRPDHEVGQDSEPERARAG